MRLLLVLLAGPHLLQHLGAACSHPPLQDPGAMRLLFNDWKRKFKKTYRSSAQVQSKGRGRGKGLHKRGRCGRQR